MRSFDVLQTLTLIFGLIALTGRGGMLIPGAGRRGQVSINGTLL